MKRCLLAIICICLAGCDHAYPPVVANGYNGPIEISVSFVSGRGPVSGSLPAKTELVQRQKGLEIEKIIVKDPSGKLRTYGQADFDNARSKRKVSAEVWILTEEGLKLGDIEDLRELKRGKH